MFKFRKAWLLGLALGLFSTLAHAQASRTWVSGVGDDANPGSRTAPCKTFAGAISKTAAGGEINVIDPGGFGAVTITKSITIDGEGALTGILAAGVNGVVINAGANDVIILRHLDINGFGTGLKGIKFMAGKTLILEHCRIYGFTQPAVSVELAASGHVIISDCEFSKNSGDAISIIPSVTSPLPLTFVDLTRVNLQANGGHGIYAGNGAQVTVRDCSISNNQAGYGINTSATTANVMVDNSDLSYNHVGVRAGAGTIRLSNTTITGNDSYGTLLGTGVIQSFGNNRIIGNANGNGPVTSVVLQ